MNLLTKAIPMVIHAALCCLTLYLNDMEYYSALGIVPAALFWFVMRTSLQARAELDCIRHPTTKNILKAELYYLQAYGIAAACGVALVYFDVHTAAEASIALVVLVVASIGIIFGTLKTFNYHTSIGKKLKKKEHQAFVKKGNADGVFENRSFQETIIGLIPCGVVVSIVCYTIISLRGLL